MICNGEKLGLRIRKGMDLKVRNIQQSQAEEDGHMKSTSQIESWKGFALIATIYFTLIVVLSAFPRFPILIPTPWITGVIFLYFAPIFLYSISVMVRPWMIVAICVPSLCLGELLWCVVYGCAGELIVYVIIALTSWGIGCILISMLRNRNEVVAMLIGVIWGFLGLLIPSLIYYAMILYWNPLYMIAISLLTTVLNLVAVPVSLALNHALRRVLNIKHLEELLLDPISINAANLKKSEY